MDLSIFIERRVLDNTGKEYKFESKDLAIEFLTEEINFWEKVEAEWLENKKDEIPRFFSAAKHLQKAKKFAEKDTLSLEHLSRLGLQEFWICSKHDFSRDYITYAKSHTAETLNGFYMAVTDQNTGTIPPQLIFGMMLGYENLNSLSSTSDRITKSKEEFRSLMDKSETTRKTYEKRFIDLEKVHNEFLTLKEPGKFWEDQAKTYQKQGWFWSLILSLVITGGLIWASNFYIAWLSGSDLRIGLNTLHGVVILGVIVTFFGFACRILSKLALSSFHLMRDAQERKLLTYLYLSLNKDNQLDQNSREIILQSLFSRSDSGLLSGDSSPTMPGGLNEIIRNLKNN